MKTSEELQPNYAPIYAAALYLKLCSLFHDHGYALAIHGSLARDFDIVAIPWGEKVSRPDEVIAEMVDKFVFRQIGEPEAKRHGRVAYTISVGFGECALDLSFFPSVGKNEGCEQYEEDRICMYGD